MYKQILKAALVACGNGAGADNAPVSISVGSYNINNLPFFIADANGYFDQVGLKVLQALVANSTDVAVGFYDYTIQM